MITKKELYRRIAKLEIENEELRRIKRINMIKENPSIKMCESYLCRGCQYCVIDKGRRGALNGEIIGCAKNIKCKDYSPYYLYHTSPGTLLF